MTKVRGTNLLTCHLLESRSGLASINGFLDLREETTVEMGNSPLKVLVRQLSNSNESSGVNAIVIEGKDTTG